MSTYKHGHGVRKGRSPEYEAWSGMRQRCLNPKNKSFKRYGGRGITVCPRWLQSFEAFYADVGPRPSAGHTLERKETNGNYEPGNVCWATRYTQNRNRSHAVRVLDNGEPRYLAEVAEARGLRYKTAWQQLKDGRLAGVTRSQGA